MGLVDFSIDEKVKAFDDISMLFYNSNFGSASKAEIELLMFHIYLEKLINKLKDKDGLINYKECSDYKISNDLGITQQQVKSLKIKKQLRYPTNDFEWKRSLASLTKYARYDQASHKIEIGIPDPNLYIEIKNYIEEMGGFIDIQLNSKLLKMRAEYYIDLIVSLEDEASRKEIIKELKKQIKKSGKDESQFDEKHIGKSLLETTVNITTIAANISGIISAENLLGKAFVSLLGANR